VIGTLQSSGAGRRGQRIDAERAAGGHLITLTAAGADASEDGTGRETPIVGFDLAQITSGENRSNPRVGDPQPPLAATGQPHVAASAAVRRLTPVECERLQGYPDGWTATSDGKPQSDSARYRQLGNSIAVPVFEWAARRIVAYEHDHSATLDT
jgi:site-specific DNA-cytosine methylase